MVVLRFAIAPALFSANQKALRAESNAIPSGRAAGVGIWVSWYTDPPAVSFPSIEILLLFTLSKTVSGIPLIDPIVMSVG